MKYKNRLPIPNLSLLTYTFTTGVSSSDIRRYKDTKLLLVEFKAFTFHSSISICSDRVIIIFSIVNDTNIINLIFFGSPKWPLALTAGRGSKTNGILINLPVNKLGGDIFPAFTVTMAA